MFKFAPGCTTSIAILASPGMEEMAKSVHQILTDKYKDNRFGYAPVPCKTFSGGELYPNLGNVRIKNMDIFLFHALNTPDPNTSLIQLYLTIDALTRAFVRSITLVTPYLCYFRQDRKDKPRVPISAKAVADMLTLSPKVERIITMDMHADQEQGFFSIPVDNLPGSLVLANHFRDTLGETFENVVAVSPDRGSWKRIQRFAKYCKPGLSCACLDKNRDESGVEFPEGMIADVRGRKAIMIDDMCATGDTFILAGNAALEGGASNVIQGVTHWIGCKKDGDPTPAEEKFRASGLKVVATNSIPRSREYRDANRDWLTIVPIDDFLAHTIYEATLIGGSISSIFDIK